MSKHDCKPIVLREDSLPVPKALEGLEVASVRYVEYRNTPTHAGGAWLEVWEWGDGDPAYMEEVDGIREARQILSLLTKEDLV